MHDGDACGHAFIDETHGRRSRAHARGVRVVGDDLADTDSRGLHGGGERSECFPGIRGSVGDLGECRHRGGAGQLAGRVASHAVGDDEEAGTGIAGVLVLTADDAHIGACCVAECECHDYFRNCMVVRPMRSGVPGDRTVGWVMRVRSSHVPLVEPRSSMTQPPSLR